MRDVTRLRDSSGFSLVEVMIAALILLIGAGAAFSLIDTANRSASSNNARVGGTNLTRELTEYARTTDYDLLQPTQLLTALRKHSSIAGSLSGGKWTIERRGVTYEVSASVCTFDDPKDGLAATPPDNACPKPAAVAGAPTEVNPDDFRRVTYTLSWKTRALAGKLSQSALVVNPAGGLGPRITKFDQPATQITGDSISWGSALPLKLESTPATTVRWSVDDGVSVGDAGGGPTAWGFDWNFGAPFVSPAHWVRDGTYTVTAQAYDSRGVPGEGKVILVHVNRHPPGPVSGFAGGYNTSRVKAIGDKGVVDMHWQRYDERDLQGYQVTRLLDNKVICPLQQELHCTDMDPPLAGSRYVVEAFDCFDLKGTCSLRDGDDTPTAVITLVAGPAPAAPTNLTASVVDGKPTLTWTPPADPVQFYRIYRDTGTNLGDRYDETFNRDATYTDPDPGSTTAHKYWVTAVGPSFNESPVSAPVLSPPVT